MAVEVPSFTLRTSLPLRYACMGAWHGAAWGPCHFLFVLMWSDGVNPFAPKSVVLGHDIGTASGSGTFGLGSQLRTFIIFVLYLRVTFAVYVVRHPCCRPLLCRCWVPLLMLLQLQQQLSTQPPTCHAPAESTNWTQVRSAPVNSHCPLDIILLTTLYGLTQCTLFVAFCRFCTITPPNASIPNTLSYFC